MVNATRTLAVLLVFLMTGTAVAQDTLNTPTWTIDPADVAWMSTASHVRGGVVNPATGHLLVASREGGVSVQVLNPATGASVGTLNVTDVAGGTFAINKIVATSDGQIFAANVVSPSATEALPFKIYWWANESAAPVLVYQGVPSAHRYGDALAVSGSGSDLVVYASGSGTPHIAIFELDGAQLAAPRLINIPAGAAQVGIVKVAGEDSLWINNPVGGALRKVSLADGTVGTTVPTTLVHGYLGELAEFHIGDQTYLAVGPGRHDGTINESRVLVLNVTDLANIEVVAETFRWGTTDNRFAPGGFVTFDEANSLLIAGSTQNAIQAFSLDFLVPPPPPPLMPIADARMEPLGTEVTVEAIVTRTRGAFTYAQDETAGITIRQTSSAFRDSINTGAIRTGTKVRVSGTTSEFNGLFQINQGAITSWAIVSQDNAVAPVDVTLADIEQRGEEYEGMLVRVSDLTITTNDAAFVAARSYTVEDGSMESPGTVLRVPSANDTQVAGLEVPTRTFTFTGALGQFHAEDPNAGYQLMAIYSGDIVQDAEVLGDPEWLIAPGQRPWLLPAGNHMRGGAYNPVTDHVIVTSRTPALGVHILHAGNGRTVGQMNIEGVTGGLFALSEVAITEDGQIFGLNLSDSGTGIRIYRWADEDSAPQLLWTGDLPPRAGDSFAVGGTGDDVRVYVSGTFNDGIIIFDWDGDELTQRSRIVAEAGVARARMGMAEVPGGEFLWINGPGTELTLISTDDGSIVREVPLATVPSGYGDLAFFELDGRQHILAGSGYQGANVFLVVDVTDAGSEEVIYETPSLGIFENQFFTGFAAFDSRRANIITGATNVAVASFSLAPYANQAPVAGQLESPANAAELRVEGDGETAFTVTWGEGSDPDGSTVLYHWQLSTSASFDELLVDHYAGTSTNFTTDFATLASILDDAGVAVNGSVTLYHRVVTTDGDDQAMSDVRTVVLTRGTLTNIDDTAGLPTEFALYGNYPNPFNPTTNIRFDLPQAADVNVQVFDILGRQVMTMQQTGMQAGANQTISLDASRLASGTYLYRITVEMQGSTRVDTGKMMLVK
jgi:hypothetical protein